MLTVTITLMGAILFLRTLYAPSNGEKVLTYLERYSASPISIDYDSDRQVIRSISGRFVITTTAANKPEEYARTFLSEHAGLFGVRTPGEELMLKRVAPRPEGGTIVQFQQVLNGVEVYGAGIKLVLDDHGAVILVESRFQPYLSDLSENDITIKTTSEQVVNAVQRQGYILASRPKLVWYAEDRRSSNGQTQATLAWFIEVIANKTNGIPMVRHLLLHPESLTLLAELQAESESTLPLPKKQSSTTTQERQKGKQEPSSCCELRCTLIGLCE